MKNTASFTLTCLHCKKKAIFMVSGRFEDFICPYCRTTIYLDEEEPEE